MRLPCKKTGKFIDLFKNIVNLQPRTKNSP